ncbi:saccharopine dehydrogenase family protein [candidate division KSB1 bacterium]
MVKIIVLGTGLVGGPIAIDLSADKDFNIAAADVNPNTLNKLKSFQNIQTFQKNLSDKKELKDLVKNYDLVVNAVPGFMGFKTLQSLIEAGKSVVDIAFFPENLFDLDQLAKKNNVTVISDMGVAPGMSNLLTGYADHMLDSTETVKIYVGGLPKIREWPYEYKAVFSPADVIEEYTRPARYIENNRLVIKPALSEPELMDFPGVGTLEAFNSDGLRSLATTIKAPDMIEKTLRYKGHIEKMLLLKETGFFSKEPIELNGVEIIPLELTSKLLFSKWQLKEGDEDITVMKIIVEGKKNNKKIRYTWDLYDTYDAQTKTHSMARTTGYAATAAVRLITSGLYSQKGVSPPEYIGKYHECVKFMLDDLKKRNVIYKETVEIFSNE